ncbi:hypothetical protein R3P38DRAFT_2784136 [Favolaschia claudopus]|uniref:Uncharacterized protein n=1 Tax=Favolaschia claudopus TaxID=2862362 RepID=A0AAW0AYB9_9AGAR
MAHQSIARRRLYSDRNPNLPLFGVDVLGHHYTLTRDGSLEDVDGPYSRFTYKPLVPQTPSSAALMEPFRKDYSKYRATIIVEIDEIRVLYHDNPLGRERNGKKCTLVRTRCPTGADTDTVKLFNMQVAKLQAIIDKDLEESPGEVATSWLGEKPDGSFTIDLMLMGTPREISMRLDLVPGSDLEVTISLCKDERFLGEENLSKTFSVWVRFWRRVSNAEIGRTLSATSMTDKDDNLVRRLVHVTNILRARNLHCDVFDFDYGAIRHSSLDRLGQDRLGQRFLYVDFRRVESTSSSEYGGRRESWSWYRPWVAGRVVKTEQQMIEYPILDSKRKRCTIIHLASTKDEELAPSGYFYKQLEVLANIIRDENALPYVKNITSWINEEDNTIQVVQCNEDDYSKLRVGDCVMFLVYLTRDEYFLTRSGEFKREYGLWADLISLYNSIMALDIYSFLEDVEENRVLADEKYLVDFGMTRDKSVEVEGTRVHCFSCKNAAHSLRHALSDYALSRKPFPSVYIGWIEGSIYSVQAEFDFRLIGGTSGTVYNCYVITLACSETAGDTEREFFSKQVAVLRQVPASRSLLGEDVNGIPSIKVMVTDDEMELWNGGDWAFVAGRTLRAAICLQRHDDFRGERHASFSPFGYTYSAWLQFFSMYEAS